MMLMYNVNGRYRSRAHSAKVHSHAREFLYRIPRQRIPGGRDARGSRFHHPAFLGRRCPEVIVQSFPVLTLEQVYGTIAYYLRHQTCLDTYLRQAEAEEAAMVEQLRHQNRALHERLVRLKSEHVQAHES
jgi:hypothetical protein